ncbi:hypothetical protein AVEN_178633-1 [Araneus ventricosus]|uniref:Uncharacterized protein n=1 Tax=Araneus ventricosus TaxID=182803 RepID=A0A4Y2UE16_ARAVE|nr:hypothetical protein AVEN_178633-1 [Araneus ventricosus]
MTETARIHGPLLPNEHSSGWWRLNYGLGMFSWSTLSPLISVDITINTQLTSTSLLIPGTSLWQLCSFMEMATFSSTMHLATEIDRSQMVLGTSIRV